MLGRGPLVARADPAGDGRGRAEREEVEDAERRGQDRPGDREPGERPRAEPADDRGVHEDVERLRDERAEGREREPPDLTIVGVAAEQRGPAHPATLPTQRRRFWRHSATKAVVVVAET